MASPVDQFRDEVSQRVAANASDAALQKSSAAFLRETIRTAYSYNFQWLSRPIIQYPQDIVAVQELIWQVRPDLIVETGVAHGGSLMLSASMLALLDYAEAVERNTILDPRSSRRRVVGIDIEIRAHNREAIESHPFKNCVELIEGSSVNTGVVKRVHEIARQFNRTLVILDSNHTHEHVLLELEAYAPLTAKGSYCLVFDTVIEDLSSETFPDRPWGKGNNPKTAVREFIRRLETDGRTASDGGHLTFEIDRRMDNKLLITVAPEGYLRRV